jgi:hypothetical protein
MNPKSSRLRIRFSLRTLFVALTVITVLPWLVGNLYWLHERNNSLATKCPVPLEGQQWAPWPLWLVGAKGFARIQIKAPPEHLAEYQQVARDRRFHWQRLFPEAEAIVSVETH